MPTKRAFLSLSVSALLAGRASAQQTQQPLLIKAGISDPVNTVLAWYMARTAGLYAAQGLNVDIMNMSGGSRGAEELQAGRIDVMHVGLSSVVKVNQAGGGLGGIGSPAECHPFSFF